MVLIEIRSSLHVQEMTVESLCNLVKDIKKNVLNPRSNRAEVEGESRSKHCLLHRFSSPSLSSAGFPTCSLLPGIISPPPTQSLPSGQFLLALCPSPLPQTYLSTLLPKPSAKPEYLSKPGCPWQTHLLSSGPTSIPAAILLPVSCYCHHSPLHPSKSESTSSWMSRIYLFK